MRKDVVFNMFKDKVKFVKPLYKKSRHVDEDKILAINFDTSFDLRGDGVYFNRNVNTDRAIDNYKNTNLYDNKSECVVLPGVCEQNFSNVPCYKLQPFSKNCRNNKTFHEDDYSVIEVDHKRKYSKMLEKERDRKLNEKSFEKNMSNGTNSKQIILHKVSDAWLRVYPAPKKETESLCSVVIRCVFCQLGLAAILVIWNIIWVFVIHSFEGPQEVQVTLDFEKEQNQLVIDLATELRQITPLSSKWREAIEKRIQDARQLTMQAVGKGAKLKPGLFWDLPGTFLFSIYVMTALGFGAPVPHTIWGRLAALVYSILAVPTHIYLMWNVSVILVVKLEQCTENLKRKYCVKNSAQFERATLENNNESSTYGANLDTLKKTVPSNKCVRKLVIFCTAHCISLLVTLYYILGVVLFGVLRDRMPLEIIMFPLEFTTTGGLENNNRTYEDTFYGAAVQLVFVLKLWPVKSHVRILYGFYIEGAMCLLACALANIRRLSSSPVACMSENYRLFHSADCNACDEHQHHQQR